MRENQTTQEKSLFIFIRKKKRNSKRVWFYYQCFFIERVQTCSSLTVGEGKHSSLHLWHLLDLHHCRQQYAIVNQTSGWFCSLSKQLDHFRILSFLMTDYRPPTGQTDFILYHRCGFIIGFIA